MAGGQAGHGAVLLRAAGTAGGRPRGTLYAVHRFLETVLGIRWWTPWATDVPKRADLQVGDRVILGDGAIRFRVESIDDGTVNAVVETGGRAQGRPGAHLTEW